MAYENGMNSIPERIAELGPGDSLGIGLSGLISGAEEYYALDIVKYCDVESNLKIFDELVLLFKNKSPVPAETEFPNIKPALKSCDFPAHIFRDEYLKKVLDENRLKRIRDSIKMIDMPEIPGNSTMITYKVPWNDEKVIESGFIDMIISQAVLQHIDGLASTYECMYKWLRKGGLMSHGIDLKCMGSSDSWDGHWFYSDLQWKIVRGRKSYLINREPYSTHIRLLKDNNFNILCVMKSISASSVIKRNDLAPKFRDMPEEDLTISGAFIQAVKR